VSVVLSSSARPDSAAFAENEAAHRALVADLDAQLQRVHAGGGERSQARHVARGKPHPRERVARLLEDGTQIHQQSPLAAPHQ
jgi:3-methylcrotonyl-CoA carboxylase beta subunit